MSTNGRTHVEGSQRNRLEVSMFRCSELADNWDEFPVLIRLPLSRAVTTDCERVVVRVTAVRLSLVEAMRLYSELDAAIEALGQRFLDASSPKPENGGEVSG